MKRKTHPVGWEKRKRQQEEEQENREGRKQKAETKAENEKDDFQWIIGRFWLGR